MPYTKQELLSAAREDYPELNKASDEDVLKALSQDYPDLVKGISPVPFGEVPYVKEVATLPGVRQGLEMAAGAGGAVAQDLVGAYNLLRKVPGLGSLLPDPATVQKHIEEATPKTTAAKVGEVGGRMLEYALPAAAESRVATATAQLPTAAKLASRALTSGIGAGVVGAAQEGGDIRGAALPAALGAGSSLTLGALGAGLNWLPSEARAIQNFETVAQKANKIRINTKDVESAADKLYDLSKYGAPDPPKVVRDLVARITDPNQPPLTFEEGRKFYSNATRLSSTELQGMTPQVKKAVVDLTRSLKSSLSDAASSVGVGDEFFNAMSEYHKAMKAKEMIEEVKDILVKKGIGALGAGALGGYAARKILE